MNDARVSIESHRDLIVWQKSMDLAVTAYRLTSSFPADERYGLTSQIRRACASIPANIAEGYGRESAGAYAQQLKVAQGSLKEFETHVELAHRIGIVDEPSLTSVLRNSQEVGKMLRSLIRAVER
ncbi:MAG TPA: four helix bundle protein [Hyphomicrobiaceae bacterium]|jgi:four helix bundle protein|nr:four helix bundle protein [Hyphomicrobiaceae bacterium]